MTIPVTLDGRGRRELRDAALKAGIRIVQFVHEPLAALYAYLRDQESFGRAVAQLNDKLVLVFDWGGGTLDLTLCRLSGNTLSQVANLGDRNIGGDRFDETPPESRRQAPSRGARRSKRRTWRRERSERSSIDASRRRSIFRTQTSSTVFVKNYLRSDGPEQTLSVRVTRADLESLTRDLVDEGIGAVHGFSTASVARLKRSSSASPPAGWCGCLGFANGSTSSSGSRASRVYRTAIGSSPKALLGSPATEPD